MSKLTDERIDDLLSEWLYVAPGRTYEEHRPFARAIEAAATAPLLQRIAELKCQLEEARKDAERYRWLFLPHTEESLSVAEQTQTMPKPSEQDAVIAHISAWYTPKSKADSIIDAAMQKGQS